MEYRVSFCSERLTFYGLRLEKKSYLVLRLVYEIIVIIHRDKADIFFSLYQC